MGNHGRTVKGRSGWYFGGHGARRPVLIATAFLSAAVFVLVACSAPENQNSGQTNAGPASATDWQAVEQALGKAGAMQPGDVYKVSLPRSDLQVMAGGVEQTALHNHVLHESPRVMYMHISAHGDAVKIARAIHDALALSKTPFTAPAAGGDQNQGLGIDTKQLDQIMGRMGKVNGGVYQFSVPRGEAVSDNGMEIPPAMGLATAINFQPTGGGKAAITGDFVLTASEVNPVIRAPRDNGIEVTALHSHMLTESPRLFFMHFWANDDAQKLARGLRAALDKMNIAKGQAK